MRRRLKPKLVFPTPRPFLEPSLQLRAAWTLSNAWESTAHMYVSEIQFGMRYMAQSPNSTGRPGPCSLSSTAIV